jgi:peptidoglycan-associated lipoprotein
MKQSIRLFSVALFGVALVFFAGCAKPSKTIGTDNTGMTDSGEMLPGAGGTDDLGAGIPLGARPSNVNPDEDVNYSLLSTETVYFDLDSSTIKSAERGKLENVSRYLTQNPNHRIMFAGHTDQSGTAEYNRGLGERRALAVRDYLIGLGVPAAQVFTISYGEDRPASASGSEADNARNRRAVPGVITK